MEVLNGNRWTCLLAGLVIAVGVASSLRAQAQPPLSLAEAQRLAFEQSPLVRGQRLGIAAARELAVAGGQLPDPVVSLGIENLPVEGASRFSTTRSSMTMRRIAVMQEITRREKRDLRVERQELEAAKGEIEVEASRAAIRRDLSVAWLDAWFSEVMAKTIADQRARAAHEVEAAEIEYRAGRGSQSAVLMARASVALIDDRAAEQARRIRVARAGMARWLGEEAKRELGTPPDLTLLPRHVSALREAFERHPEIAALQSQERIMASDARLAQANRTPDWSVELAYNVRGSTFGDMVSIGVSMPLPWDRANRQDREVAAKVALAGQAAANREEALRRLAAEFGTMVAEWESNRERLKRFDNEIHVLMTTRSEAAETTYRAGKGSLGEVLGARRAELDIRLQALQLEQETARLWAQLNYLIPEAQ